MQQQQQGAEMRNYPPNYGQQPPAGNYVVQVQPNATSVGHDYTIPRAKACGILMIMAAFFMAFGLTRMNSMAFLVPATTYGIVGALCLLVHHDNPRGRGLVTWLLTMACMTLIVSVDIDSNLIIAIVNANSLRSYTDPGLVIGYSIFLLLVNLTTFILSIILIVFTSKKLCQCCGAPPL